MSDHHAAEFRPTRIMMPISDAYLAAMDADLVEPVDAVHEGEDRVLEQLSMLSPGTMLQAGAEYLDLNDPARQPFRAFEGQDVCDHERIIAKNATSYELWNQLTGIDDSPGS